MFEERMNEKIRDFIIESGFIPYDQIPLFHGKIDFVGVNNDDCMVIESKVQKWKDAIRQVLVYGQGATISYIALPNSTANYVIKKYRNKLEKYNIGLLSVDINSNKKIEILLEGKKEYCSPVYKKYVLYNVENRKNKSDERIRYFIEKSKRFIGCENND